LFIWLLPVFFIHTGYNELFGLLPAGLVLKNLLVVSAGIVSAGILSYLYMQNLRKTALYTFICALLILFFGYFHDLLKASILPGVLTKYSVLTLLLLLLFVIFAIWLKRNKSTFYQTYQYLNVLMLIFLLFETGKSITAYASIQKDQNLLDPRFSVYNSLRNMSAIADTSRPDIYLIVFDEMPSSAGLKKYFGRDNSALDDTLSRAGFYVVRNGRSNYFHTVYSLASMFNMEYLPGSAELIRNPSTYLTCIESLSNNSLTAFLRSQGYVMHQYQPLSFPPAQTSFTSHFDILRTAHFFYKTLPGRLYRDLYWNLYRTNIASIDRLLSEGREALQQQRVQDLRKTTELIKKSCSTGGAPKFVYGHYILPHAPYTFNRNGAILPSDPNDPFDKKTDQMKAYYEQVLYADRLIEELVSYIKNNNRKRTLIVIMGDHGYRPDLNQAQTDAAFYNLSAMYFPDGNYRYVNDSLTSVNTFRVILNSCFNTQLPLLKDSLFRMDQTDPDY